MKTRVVLLDDDFSGLQALKNYCERLNLEVIAAYQSPREFIDSLNKISFDLAILDYFMPQFNGLEVAEILNSKDVPVIFVTGHRNEIAAKLWDMNCIGCIEKPVNIEKLRSALAKMSGIIKPEDHKIKLELHGGQIAYFKISEIVHIGTCDEDNSGNDKFLTDQAGNKHRIIKKKMEDFMAVLPTTKFMRVGKSDIVAKDAITRHSKTYEEITLSIKDKREFHVYVSDSRKEDFKNWFQS